MRFRKLRIAFSALCGLAAVLLLVLWVRSYWTAGAVGRVNGNSACTIGSNHGIVYFVYDMQPHRPVSSPWWAQHTSTIAPAVDPTWSYFQIGVVDYPPYTLELHVLGDLATGTVPDFLLVGLCTAAGAAPWIWPKRFTLRTLLIVTTLVAIVLGLIVAVV
jgi:hypothetical protein